MNFATVQLGLWKKIGDLNIHLVFLCSIFALAHLYIEIQI